jgi:uncharacterized protein
MLTQPLALTRSTNRIVTFFVLTFALTWGVWLPFWVFGEPGGDLVRIMGTFGPTLAALILTTTYDGSAGLLRLLRGLFIWRIGCPWYLFSLLGTAAIVLPSIWLHVRLGGDSPTFNDAEDWYLIFVYFFYILFLSVLGEEIGWRGYALPWLQGRYNALTSSIILGLVWGIWHAPLFLTTDGFHNTIPFTLFILQAVALSIIMTWLFNNSRGSLLIVIVFHAASNTTLGIFPVMPADNAGSARPLWIAVALLWAITLMIVARFGPARLSRHSQPVPHFA